MRAGSDSETSPQPNAYSDSNDNTNTSTHSNANSNAEPNSHANFIDRNLDPAYLEINSGASLPDLSQYFAELGERDGHRSGIELQNHRLNSRQDLLLYLNGEKRHRRISQGNTSAVKLNEKHND